MSLPSMTAAETLRPSGLYGAAPNRRAASLRPASSAPYLRRIIQAAYVPPHKRQGYVPPQLSADQIKFNAVMADWIPGSNPDAAQSVRKPQGWDTTFQWSVDTQGYGPQKVRGHVHYREKINGAGYDMVPGGCWVSGIRNIERQMPQAAIDVLPNDPPADFGNW